MSKEIGALISLQPNASRIAKQFGLEPFFENAKPAVDQAFNIYSIEGDIVNSVKLPTESSEKARICYHRMDLHSALREAATTKDDRTRPAELLLASRVTSCDVENGVVATANGESFEADLIIGADGIHSVCRQAIFMNSEDAQASAPKPTGVSAYRLLLDTARIEELPQITKYFDPRQQVTSMMLGFNQRIVMGPAREGDVFGVVALVPDENLHESSGAEGSWTTPGSPAKMLESFSQFPQWIKNLLSLGAENADLALWQLRDIDPLPRWSRGRLLLVGDAAHAMLPTQGQGASQSFEDAEAVGSFLNDIHPNDATSAPKLAALEALGLRYFKCRYERATLIQGYSRQHGQAPGAEQNSKRVTLDPGEFMKYNTSYEGAKAWERSQNHQMLQAVHQSHAVVG